MISKRMLEEVLIEVIENADEQKDISLGRREGSVAELKKRFTENMGILVHGYYDADGNFHMEYYIPYIEGKSRPVEDDITITRHVARESFAGVCEDMRLGATLIYYVQNGMEYLERALKQRSAYYHGEVYLSGLSTGGTILLPVSKNEKQREQGKQASMNRKQLISDAKRGDEAAIESLTIEDLDTYTRISRRIRSEDVFSIVDSSFMPYGVECDQYSIVGEIMDVQTGVNSYTDEKVYTLLVDCNELEVAVGINEDDLIGEPQVGRRFKGAIWLLGRVRFS